MDKIKFENKPSTNTPVSAKNLNLMQDNIEKAINSGGGGGTFSNIESDTIEDRTFGTIYRNCITIGNLFLQWGIISNVPINGPATFNLKKPFANDKYSIQLNSKTEDVWNAEKLYANIVSNSSFEIKGSGSYEAVGYHTLVYYFCIGQL